MDKSKYIFQSKIASCSYSQILIYPFGENVYLMTVQMLLMRINLELIELLKLLIV